MQDVVFHEPTDLPEALELLATYGEDARPIAGGTALVVMMKQSLVVVGHLVSLQKIPELSGISIEEDRLHIGALTSHRSVETSPLVLQHVPFLAEVYRRVATIRIRNSATVGGGLAHADPSQDPPAALIVLDARVRVASPAGMREIAVADLFAGYYETSIAPDELIVEVIVPIPTRAAGTTYLKHLPRTQDDYATVAVAALGEVGHGVCRRLRVALIAAGPTPVRALAVESFLEGRGVTPETIQTAAGLVAGLVDPLDDARGSATYKRDMATVFARRALTQVLMEPH